MSEVNDKVKRDSALHARHRQRMKNKFLKYGLEAFEEHEVVELLLYFALPYVDTNEIAHKLINKGGSFIGAFNLSYDEMKTVSGVKDQAATFLKLIPELAHYYSMKEALHSSKPGLSYEDIAKLCVKSLIARQKEELICIYFDAQMKLITVETLSSESFYNVSSSFRQITDRALKLGAVNIAMAHNHPSAVLIPSSQDLSSTKRLKDLLAEADIILVEHFIVSAGEYCGIIKENESIINGKFCL